MDTHARRPAGTSIGGQFAPVDRPEADLGPGGVDLGATAPRLTETQAREAAVEALRAFDQTPWTDREVAAPNLVAAAEGLRAALPPDEASPLRVALLTYNDAGPYDGDGALNVLHAEMTDALTDAPTHTDVKTAGNILPYAFVDATNAAVARDLGISTDADAEVARQAVADAAETLERLTERRRQARIARVAAGRPTLYDMQEAQAEADDARDLRRTLVLNADAARSAYAETPADHPDLARRWEQAETATAAQERAEADYQTAAANLASANAAWRKRQRLRPHT